jgi:hypothetical protein
MALYGEQIWPTQIVFYLAAVATTLLVFLRPGAASDNVVRAYLALTFGWISIVFFLLIGRDLAGNLVFTGLFGVVALLFAVDLVRQRMQFHLPTKGVMRFVVWAIALVILAYPAFSLAFGHMFPRTIVLGSYPCPNTALGLLFLTLALPRVEKIAYFLLLLWAVPLPPAIQIPKYGVYEDAIMLSVGIYALVMLALHWTGRLGVPQQRTPTA